MTPHPQKNRLSIHRKNIAVELDIFPTLNELADLEPIAAHQGVSLVPLVRNPSTEWDRPAVIEYRKGNAAVRSDRYRYIRYQGGGEELYDHQTDPHEWHNLADETDLQPIKEELAGWITKTWADVAPGKDEYDFDPGTFVWKHKKTGKVTNGKQRR